MLVAIEEPVAGLEHGRAADDDMLAEAGRELGDVLLDRASLEEQYAREELEKLATARRTYGCGTEVLRSLRRGSIEYSRIPELRGIDLEPYRKRPVEVVRINLSPVPTMPQIPRTNLTGRSYE